MVYNMRMANNEQEPSWGDIAEEWLKSQGREKPVSEPNNDLETLVDQNPDLRVLRGVEGDIHIWVTMEGKKRLITLSRRIRNLYSSDFILTSHEISTEGDTLPQYTHLIARPIGDVVHFQGKTTETNLDFKLLLSKAKTGLNMLKLRDGATNSDQERFSDKIADYWAEKAAVKKLVLGQMINFVDFYAEGVKE